jgi:glycerophosphoryl diester phosphodiesterase
MKTRARPWNIAHRGASGHLPENTLQAFRGAMEMGADGVELDVQETQDGVLIVHHDDTVAGKRIVELSHQQLLARIERGSREAPPTLPQVLAQMAEHPGAIVLVELKIVHSIERYLAAIATVPETMDLRTISFDAELLRGVRDRRSDVRVGLLTAKRPRDPVGVLSDLGATMLLPAGALVQPDLVAMIHGAGLELLTWTIDEEPDIVRCLELGVDGIISNFPDRVRSVLRRSSHRT